MKVFKTKNGNRIFMKDEVEEVELPALGAKVVSKISSSSFSVGDSAKVYGYDYEKKVAILNFHDRDLMNIGIALFCSGFDIVPDAPKLPNNVHAPKRDLIFLGEEKEITKIGTASPTHFFSKLRGRWKERAICDNHMSGGDYYASERGGELHRAQPWFDEDQLPKEIELRIGQAWRNKDYGKCYLLCKNDKGYVLVGHNGWYWNFVSRKIEDVFRGSRDDFELVDVKEFAAEIIKQNS